jgi:hypothetical protein
MYYKQIPQKIFSINSFHLIICYIYKFLNDGKSEVGSKVNYALPNEERSGNCKKTNVNAINLYVRNFLDNLLVLRTRCAPGVSRSKQNNNRIINDEYSEIMDTVLTGSGPE